MSVAKRNKNNKNPSNNATIVLPNSLNAEKLEQIIANALIASEDAKEQRLKKTKRKDIEELRAFIGYKDHLNKKGIKNSFLASCNCVKALVKLFFIPKSLIKGDIAILGLLKIFLGIFFELAKFLTLAFGLFAIVYAILQLFFENIPALPLLYNIHLFPLAFFSLLLSGFFRIASIEIDKSEDKNLLFNVFASIGTIISIALAAIAIVTSN